MIMSELNFKKSNATPLCYQSVYGFIFIMLGIINFESLIICLSIDTSFDMIDLQGD